MQIPRYRAASIILSIFMAISPLLPYLIGALYNSLHLKYLQEVVNSIPDVPGMNLVKREFADEIAFRGPFHRNWEWTVEYAVGNRREDLVSFYRRVLPQQGWRYKAIDSGDFYDMDVYTHPSGLQILISEHGYGFSPTTVFITTRYTYNTLFDFKDLPWAK